MGSKWRKAKLSLGLNMCLHVPLTLQEEQEREEENLKKANNKHQVSSSSSTLISPGRFSDAVSISHRPSTPTPSSSGLHLPKPHSPKSNKKTCAICLTTMKPGHGHAIFMAECSHSFHFHCITSSVKHGNQICPICRANWKEVPFQNPASGSLTGRRKSNMVGLPRDDAYMTILRRIPPPRMEANRQIPLFHHAHEPEMFDDDEALEICDEIAERNTSNDDSVESKGTVEVKMIPEVVAVGKSASHDDFTVLIHLKAPIANGIMHSCMDNTGQAQMPESPRAFVDLVTVLDVSGSMAGTKLALLKRAMGFVIQNLGPSDRLSVVVFSSAACRLFPLRRMTESGRQEALLAIHSLTSNGGTNIAEGLRKGAKVLVHRKWKNPVGSIMLLSDGQDTYSAISSGGTHHRRDYKSLLPKSINRNGGPGLQIPVHAFGFGADHDAASMHSISEISGGTFSFIEAEGVIQDAFAQCIGGLLSVVVQEFRVKVECVHPRLHISSLKAGSYKTNIMSNSRISFIDVGDLYAEEERDFLVTVNVPADGSCEEMSLLKVGCTYNDPRTKRMTSLEGAGEVTIQRPELITAQVVSVEVDRQRNRLHAAEAMSEARLAAENGDLSRAVYLLESCYNALLESASCKAGDRLCVSLCAELKEMQERMANRRIYEASGRAYVLSGLSSHLWQRATARGDSTDNTSLLQAYQTPSMVDMVSRSQTMIFGAPSSQRKLRQTLSFPATKLQPR